MDGGGGWGKSFSLSRRRWDHVGKMVVSVRRWTSSFYFTSFSDRVKAKELYEIFSEHGEVDEVIIPGKRDKHGKRFRFVRLFDVVEEERLAVKLDNIFIREQKLFVNIPRFQRGSKVQVGSVVLLSVRRRWLLGQNIRG